MNGLEEGDGGVGRADDGGDTGGEQRETEETVADVAGSKAESLGCGVGSASDSRDIFSHNDRTGRADTEHAQEQQDTNAARDTDAGQDGLAEVLDFFRLAAPTRVKQLVCARKGNVPAAGAAEQRDHDGNEFLGILRGKDMDDRIADGGLAIKATTSMTTIMMPPRIWATLPTMSFAFLERKMQMASTPPMMTPAFSGMPIMALKPSDTPPTLPILNARPPSTTSTTRRYPRPGRTLLAIS